MGGWNSMKKIICIILLIILSIYYLNNNFVKGYSNNEQDIQKSISNKLIRFHIIANSDSAEDQTLKLKLRDKVLEYIAPKLKNCKTLDESRSVLKSNEAEIKKICETYEKKSGYSYSIKTMLSRENFPVKSYGVITLPQGEYEAFRIIIGEGKGQNWWCVMFPPLCFIDISKGEVEKKETEKTMKQVLNDREFNAVDNVQNGNNKNQIKVKFKVLDYIEEIKDKFFVKKEG